MYAIIEDSGKQFRVAEGDVLDVDIRELPEGASSVEFDRVLLVSNDGNIRVGTPIVGGAKVTADVVEADFKGEKTLSVKFRRRKRYRRRTGHRQHYMKVRIAKIVA